MAKHKTGHATTKAGFFFVFNVKVKITIKM